MKKFMGMEKLMSVIFVFLLSACATTKHVFLTEPNSQLSKNQNFIPDGELNFSLDSAKSIKENSNVEIGSWHIIYGKNRQVFRFDIRITNTTQNILLTPDDIIIVDADKKSLRILSPDEFVYYAKGMTSQEALSQSSVMSIYASQLQKTYGYSGTMYSYGTTYGNYYSGFSTFRAYPIQDPYSSFAGGFAQGYALGAAIQAAQISRMVRECRLTALKPASTLPQCSNIGRVWSLAGKLPIEIHIFTLGDHHIIKLDQTQKKERQ